MVESLQSESVARVIDDLHVGVELGGTSCKIAIFQRTSTQLIRQRFQVFETSSEKAMDTFEAMRDYLKKELKDISGSSSGGDSHPSTLGIAAFGPICLDESSPKYGEITTTPKLAWQNFPVYSLFKQAFGFGGREDRIFIDTDVNVCALFEYQEAKRNYPAPPGVTDVLGLECAGRVVLSGANTNEEVLGERVIALLSGGGYAQYAKVPASHTISIPEGIEMEAAACFTEVWATAYQILFLVADAQPGETVLVHAAASGVGTAMLQLAKLAGIKTIAVASTTAKLERCTSFGATYTINYKELPDFQARVLELTDLKGVEVIADPIGAQNYGRNAACCSVDARWILYGFMGGSKVESMDMGLLLKKRIQLISTTLKSRSIAYKADLLQKLRTTLFGQSGDQLQPGVQPVLDKVFPMSQARDAHLYMESNQSIGKILLKQDLNTS